MNELLTLGYWFNSRPAPFGNFGQTLLIAAIVVFLIGSLISWRFYKRQMPVYHKVWQSLFSFCIANVIVALFWAFFDYQMIPILMSKIWYLLWLIEALIWFIMILIRIKKIPQRKQELTKQQEFNKYIPK